MPLLTVSNADTEGAHVAVQKVTRLRSTSMVGRASELDLSASARQALEALLLSESNRVMDACADLNLRGPVCALAFLTTDDEPMATVGYAALLTEPRRCEIVTAGDLEILWSPADWDHPDFLPPDARSSTLEQSSAVGRALLEAGAEDAEAAFCRELAYRLNRAKWPEHPPVTDDFICTTSEHELTEIKHNVQLLARPCAAQAWADNGWLRLATLRADSLPQLDPTLPKVPGLDEVLIDLGATPEQAQQISAALREYIYDLDELDDWLDAPGFDELLSEEDQIKLDNPDWTARDAIRSGHIELVLAAARGEAGE